MRLVIRIRVDMKMVPLLNPRRQRQVELEAIIALTRGRWSRKYPERHVVGRLAHRSRNRAHQRPQQEPE